MGEVVEEEPEGEAVVGPSREATAHSSGNTSPSLFFLVIKLYSFFYRTHHHPF